MDWETNLPQMVCNGFPIATGSCRTLPEHRSNCLQHGLGVVPRVFSASSVRLNKRSGVDVAVQLWII